MISSPGWNRIGSPMKNPVSALPMHRNADHRRFKAWLEFQARPIALIKQESAAPAGCDGPGQKRGSDAAFR
jgi:hypothetical protein